MRNFIKGIFNLIKQEHTESSLQMLLLSKTNIKLYQVAYLVQLLLSHAFLKIALE